MSDEVKKEQALAVGHIPSGLFIVCAHDNESGSTDGFLASWIQQISFNPLRVSLCIKPGRPAYETIKNKKVFSINIVGENNKNFLKHFWSGYNPEKKPFSEIDHKITSNGGVIIKEAKSTIICQLEDSIAPGDHELVIANVLECHVQDTDSTPMVHIRKSGLDY